jgi:hypothetical protein
VIYRDGKAKADQVPPLTTFVSENPEDLWTWMRNYEAKTGGQVLAIPHNGNLSNGLMFALNTFKGDPLTKAWAEARANYEPLYEITQGKGTSEQHPSLAPNDEFARFEIWDKGNLNVKPKTPGMIGTEYAREALKNGLSLEAALGANPFKFGFVGSTDNHTGMATAEENNFFSKFPAAEPAPERWDENAFDFEGRIIKGWELGASGYTGIWATENTREALWDAMKRREVYATTGPRITVRFFGGFDFAADDALSREPGAIGYEKGVPMGGDLARGPAGKPPTFLVAAMKDPLSGNLDRIQIVKGWVDAAGKTHEKVYDVAWGDADERRTRRDGKLPPVGNTVDLKTATWRNTIGDPELRRVDRSGLRSEAARVLLRARDRDPDAALDGLRRGPLRREDGSRGADDAAGTRVHVADLVRPGLTNHGGRRGAPRQARAPASAQVPPMRRLLREPLVHFLLIGLALFLWYGRAGTVAEDPLRIVVTQAQVDAIAARFGATWSRPPTAAELRGLVDAHVRDEILYREGEALGLGRDDAVVKRRVRQKFEVMSEELLAHEPPTDAELAEYLATYAARFREPTRVTFEQVLVTPAGASVDVAAEVARVRRALAAGADPARVGAPTMLSRGDANAPLDLVARDFGAEFARELERVPLDAWAGPVTSGFGVHLVRVAARTPGSVPPLAAIRSAVAREWENDRRQRGLDEQLTRLRENYRVEIEGDVQQVAAR